MISSLSLQAYIEGLSSCQRRASGYGVINRDCFNHYFFEVNDRYYHYISDEQHGWDDKQALSLLIENPTIKSLLTISKRSDHLCNFAYHFLLAVSKTGSTSNSIIQQAQHTNLIFDDTYYFSDEGICFSKKTDYPINSLKNKYKINIDYNALTTIL